MKSWELVKEVANFNIRCMGEVLDIAKLDLLIRSVTFTNFLSSVYGMVSFINKVDKVIDPP